MSNLTTEFDAIRSRKCNVDDGHSHDATMWLIAHVASSA